MHNPENMENRAEFAKRVAAVLFADPEFAKLFANFLMVELRDAGR